ncbi:DUF6415 family natural product biosynthesis protein [Streptomyces sp. f51]|uniref:DUF6415 family natural product biosynthesis protein n=1 Tax=Streptomyces sp. f51 TaxID=1827742 RepID=UPI0030CAD813
MPKATATETANEGAGVGPLPPDIETMRTSARLLLADDGQVPEDLHTLALMLTGHINVLIPAVEKATRGLPRNDIPRACAMACIGEAGIRLRIGWPEDLATVQHSVAMKLARSVNALCDHYENLRGSARAKN